uniref:C2H2-type domain-containing protein n=1 Tax=Amphilophus citrinellus TaxID=61819 RepID=A0A3Q0SNE3_AMPCI
MIISALTRKEQVELCSSQEGEQLVLKEETDTFMVTAVYEESDLIEPEPDREQLLSHSFAVAESRDQEGSRSVDSGPSRVTNRIHSNNASNSRMSVSQGTSETGKKSLKCDVCGRAFKKKCQVKEHRKIHTGEKPHSCKICERSFTQKSTMLRHMIIHTKEKSYSCQTCGKTFSQSGNLYVHMRIHTGEKPYSCKTCGKMFARSNHMLRHMKTHTGEKSCKQLNSAQFLLCFSHSFSPLHLLHTRSRHFHRGSLSKLFSWIYLTF